MSFGSTPGVSHKALLKLLAYEVYRKNSFPINNFCGYDTLNDGCDRNRAVSLQSIKPPSKIVINIFKMTFL